MRTFNAAINEAREIVGDGATVWRHIDKAGPRSAWVSIELRSVHAGAAASLQLGTWTRRLTDAGWTLDDDGSLWVETDPDVPYDDRALAVAPLSPLAALLVEIADHLEGEPPALHPSPDLLARIRDTAAEFRR